VSTSHGLGCPRSLSVSSGGGGATVESQMHCPRRHPSYRRTHVSPNSAAQSASEKQSRVAPGSGVAVPPPGGLAKTRSSFRPVSESSSMVTDGRDDVTVDDTTATHTHAYEYCDPPPTDHRNPIRYVASQHNTYFSYHGSPRNRRLSQPPPSPISKRLRRFSKKIKSNNV